MDTMTVSENQDAQEEEEQPEEEAAHCLVIITSPASLSNSKSPIRFVIAKSDTVDDVKLQLRDVRETCFLTHYAFQMTQCDGTSLMLRDFVEVAVFLEKQEESLTASPQQPSASGPQPPLEALHLLIVLLPYNAKKARDHLRRTHECILYPQIQQQTFSEPSPNADPEPFSGQSVPADLFSPAKLSAFFDTVLLRCGQIDPTAASIPTSATILTTTSTPAAAAAAGAKPPSPSKPAPRLLTDCIKSISLSGWSPPPPSRKAQGIDRYIRFVDS